MPQEGSFISYCGHGVCRIDGLRKMNFGKGEQDYLVIAPLSENGATIYLSADNPKIQTKIRPVLTKAEIDSVLAGIRSERMTWIEDRKARVARFQQILSQSEPRTLLLMAFCLQARREEKGLPSSELEILHKAQNIIEQEFSFALELPKQEIRQYVEQTFGYDLNRTCDEIRPTYHHVETCQQTVPEAIIAFLESVSFEDALRNAVSLGGDSDTLACITGGIAEAFYGMPQELRDETLKRLPEDIREGYELFRWNIGQR